MKQLARYVKRVQTDCEQCGIHTDCIVEESTWEDDRVLQMDALCPACHKGDKLFDSYIEGVYEDDKVRLGNVVIAVQKLSTPELTSFLHRVGNRLET